MVRLMLTGYVLIALVSAFNLGQNTTFHSDGILLDTPYLTYWLDYGGVAQ
jgi:hypothetical protein